MPDSRPRPVPDSLTLRSLQPLWAAVRRHLDRFGSDRRGTIARPDLHPGGAQALESLLGGPLSKRLDLAAVEASLSALGVGEDLDEALTLLGHPPSEEAAGRRVARARSAASRAALRQAAESWAEPWAPQWAESIIRSGLHGGLDAPTVGSLACDVRRLLDRLESPVDSRTELAAALFGSAHALDPGTRLAAYAARALRCRLDTSLDGRALWEAAGIGADRVSAPALAWSVPATGRWTLAQMLRSAAAGGLPLHMSLLALRREPVTVAPGTPVLVVENPRLVEAACERGLPCCVVAANGNPATAVTTLLTQMQDSGALLWYHGDFDAAGLAICRRMLASGCRPWMMAARDYRDAISTADRNGVRLDTDIKDCGPTPWDPRLETAFNDGRLIVHEEFVLDEVLNEFSLMASSV